MARAQQADHPNTDQELAKAIRELLHACPTSTRDIAAHLQRDRKVTKMALQRMAKEGRLVAVGIGPGRKWALPPTQESDARPQPIAGLPPVSAEAEAIRLARRGGHSMGPFKPSTLDAAPGRIALCTSCDTYVTVDPKGKVGGPGVHHDCVAARAGA